MTMKTPMITEKTCKILSKVPQACLYILIGMILQNLTLWVRTLNPTLKLEMIYFLQANNTLFLAFAGLDLAFLLVMILCVYTIKSLRNRK